MEDRYLNVTEAAERLGLSRHTLNQWRLRGRGPAFVRLGRAVRYAVSDLDAWARANRIEVGRGRA
jgi:excisionase family DNA binding protein